MIHKATKLLNDHYLSESFEDMDKQKLEFSKYFPVIDRSLINEFNLLEKLHLQPEKLLRSMGKTS